MTADDARRHHRNTTIDFGSVSLTGQLLFDPGTAVLELLTDEGPETISIDLSQPYGILPELGNVIVKDWSEHSGLAQRLDDQGIVKIVRQHRVLPHGAGGYPLVAYEVEVLEPADRPHHRK